MYMREAERSPASAHTHGRPVSIRPQAQQVIRRWPLGTLDTVYSIKVCFTPPDTLLRLTYVTP
jgi:hypothetical protein